jgi:hypothetical protein
MACDQEFRVEHCEIYDTDGMCVECHCDYGLYWEGTTSDDGT